MKILETVGIDMSKLSFDTTIYSTGDHCCFDNTKDGFERFFEWIKTNLKTDLNNTLFALEHTGRYSYEISMFFKENEISFILLSGLELARSMGISRGKDDKIDSKKIARFAYRRREELVPTQLPEKEMLSLKRLLTLRNRLVRQRAGYKASLNEDKSVYNKNENKVLIESQDQIIKALSKEITRIDKEMQAIINGSKMMKKQFKLLNSIKGIGPQTAMYMIVVTSGFFKFKTARKFASYCGIAPFPNRSGTSLKGRTKISALANKKIKHLLSMCASSAIQYNLELKTYYERRVKEGKSKGSTLNIIRNKLLTRMFAVVSRETPYVNTMKFAS